MAGFPSQDSDTDFDGYVNNDKGVSLLDHGGDVQKEDSSPQLCRVLVSQLVEKDRLASAKGANLLKRTIQIVSVLACFSSQLLTYLEGHRNTLPSDLQ